MEIIIIFAGFILGTIIGSFLNVVALRFNTGKSLAGRSECFSCKKSLSWYELFPVLSWCIQRGRCRHCSSKISPQYFFGEITAGVFFALVTARGIITSFDWFSNSYLISTLFLFLVFGILLVVLFYDIRHKIIPDMLSLVFGLLSFGGMFFFGFENSVFTYIGFHIPELVELFSGILIPLPFVLLWIFSKGRWLGLGDPKLMIGMGFLLGLQKGISAVFVSFWLGALYVIVMVVFEKITKKSLLRSNKKSIMKQELPFAPFLIIGTLIVLVSTINLFAL
jgi:prepilin signal peptidase PulO-like enzyme (type II secretory pathway)